METRAELTSLTEARSAEALGVSRRVQDLKTRVDILNHQLTQAESERSQVEVDNKLLARKLDECERCLAALKDKVQQFVLIYLS